MRKNIARDYPYETTTIMAIQRRITSRFDMNGAGCWIWNGTLNTGGYGVAYLDGINNYRAHRFIYELVYGPIDRGLVLDHLCRVRHCVNPRHMEAVTQEVNLARGRTANLKTHCHKGHPFAGDNLKVFPNGFRRCRACYRAALDRQKEARRLYNVNPKNRVR